MATSTTGWPPSSKRRARPGRPHPRSVAQEDAGRPGAGDQAAQCTGALARPRSARRARGAGRSAASCRSLRSAAARARLSASARAATSSRDGAPRRERRATARRSAGRPPGWTARRRGTTTHQQVARSGIGVTSSPRPTPCAVPPTRANGTSLPSAAAIASRSSSVVLQVPQPVERHQRGGRVGAAAGQATGDRDALAISMPRPRARCRGARRAGDRPDDDVGLTGWESRPVDVVLADQVAPPTPRPSRTRDVVVQADGLVDGRQRVVAVRAGPPRRPGARLTFAAARTVRRLISWSSPGSSLVHLCPARDSAIRTKSASRSCSPRVIGSTPAASRASDRLLRGAGEPTQRGAERLAALGERGVDDGEDLLAGDRGGRWVAAGPGDQARVDVRAPARRRCGRSPRPGVRRRTRRP